MRIVCIGGGPAGLYFALLMKKRDPAHRITVFERNRRHDTFGFGVVFSDATLGHLERADRESYRRIRDGFHHWDDIEIHVRGEVQRSTGHGFAGVSRKGLLDVLVDRCQELGVEVRHETEIKEPEAFLDHDLVIAADGANSMVRQRHAAAFGPSIDLRNNRFVWLGTTCPFPAFTFCFKENEHGLFRVHAYQYEAHGSTFIVETSDAAFARAGLREDDEAATVAYMEELFARELRGHRLLANRSVWRRFPTVKNARWHHGRLVLMGDAAHTAHFSVGSGTKLAMEDAIALERALRAGPAARPLAAALAAYEAARRPEVESLQRAAQVSLEWFEDAERHLGLEPVQFGYSLLTRSLRVTHRDLAQRDPDYVRGVDRWFAARAAARNGAPAVGALPAPPPVFTPLRLRELVLDNRVVVSPMCQYMAEDGVVDDWHLVHLGSRAVGGAGLVMTEMTDVAPDARITPGCAGLWRDDHVAAWRRVTRFVHRYTRSRIGVQLAHAGRKGSTKRAFDGMDEPLEEGGWPLVAPSAIPWAEGSPVPRAMDRADMERVRDEFVRAAELAEAAGFDLLELHCAHGYLLGSFLSPLTNRRDDDYGGALDNRMRFPLEVFRAVRATWPAAKPISVRISAVDWKAGGNTADDAVALARLFKQAGADLLDVSAGQTVPDQRPVYGRQFQTPFAERIRNEVGIATIAVGNITSWPDVNSILAAGRADLCALARTHLFDPYWTRHAAARMGHPLPWPKPYQSITGFEPRFE